MVLLRYSLAIAFLCTWAADVLFCAATNAQGAPAGQVPSSDASGEIRPLQSCVDTDSAYRALFEEAMRLLETGSNPVEALALFQLADASCSSLAAVEGQARALLALGRLAEAHARLKRVEDVPERGWAKAVAQQLKTIEAEMAQRGYGTLVVRFEPADAELAVDDQAVSFRQGQLIWRVAPGQHTLLVRRAGFAPVTHAFTMESAGNVAKTISLRPMSAGAASPPVTP